MYEILSAENGIYLSYSDFHPYLLVDASYMKELNQWFTKKLDTVGSSGPAVCISWLSCVCTITQVFSFFPSDFCVILTLEV